MSLKPSSISFSVMTIKQYIETTIIDVHPRKHIKSISNVIAGISRIVRITFIPLEKKTNWFTLYPKKTLIFLAQSYIIFRISAKNSILRK